MVRRSVDVVLERGITDHIRVVNLRAKEVSKVRNEEERKHAQRYSTG